jgi:hypothetical protein
VPRHLTTIEDLFQITGRGLVVVPGPLKSDFPGPSRQSVLLRMPDGTAIEATLELQHFLQSPPPKENRWGALLHGVAKNDVQIGTEVWSSDAI